MVYIRTARRSTSGGRVQAAQRRRWSIRSGQPERGDRRRRQQYARRRALQTARGPAHVADRPPQHGRREIIAVLSAAAFANSEPEDTQLTTLTTRAQRLLDEMHALAASV